MANIPLCTDSYKFSHAQQYPPGMSRASSYIEARNGGRWDSTSFFGLQGFLGESGFMNPVTEDDVDYAEEIVLAHGLPFNRAGWEHILDEHSGFLPIEIQAVPEGLEVPTGNVLVQFQNTDPACAWLTSYLETKLLQGVWYPTTVATNSKRCKGVITKFLAKTGCEAVDEVAAFALHDFGYRGASSEQSAKIGGAAHLTNFWGSDTIVAVEYIRKFYAAGLPPGYMPAFSIPASEHSTITAWGKDGEEAAFANMLDTFLVPESIVACVSDSYDIMHACDLWGTTFKQQIEESNARLVVRPDSGDPVSVSLAVIERLGKYFIPTVNSAGFKVLPDCIRVIYGDGINEVSIEGILKNLAVHGWAAENINFGMGGALLQGVDRDTLRFACKLSEVEVNGKIRPVCKSPVDSGFKSSKAGRLALVRDPTAGYKTVAESSIEPAENVLRNVFEDGTLLIRENFETIRERASL